MGIFGEISKGFKKDKDKADSKEKRTLEPGQMISCPGRIPAEALKMLESWRLEAILSSPTTPGPSGSEPSPRQKLWLDETSMEAEERLREKGIQVPWHYGDNFWDRFKVIGLRAGGIGAVFFVKDTRFR